MSYDVTCPHGMHDGERCDECYPPKKDCPKCKNGRLITVEFPHDPDIAGELVCEWVSCGYKEVIKRLNKGASYHNVPQVGQLQDEINELKQTLFDAQQALIREGMRANKMEEALEKIFERASLHNTMADLTYCTRISGEILYPEMFK